MAAARLTQLVLGVSVGTILFIAVAFILSAPTVEVEPIGPDGLPSHLESAIEREDSQGAFAINWLACQSASDKLELEFELADVPIEADLFFVLTLDRSNEGLVVSLLRVEATTGSQTARMASYTLEESHAAIAGSQGSLCGLQYLGASERGVGMEPRPVIYGPLTDT